MYNLTRRATYVTATVFSAICWSAGIYGAMSLYIHLLGV